MRLTRIDEGELLLLWVTMPWEMQDVEEGDEADDDLDSDIPF
jgi:hypothetical protein